MKQETGVHVYQEWPDPEVQTWRDIGGKEIAGDPTVSTHGREYSLAQEYKDNCNRTDRKARCF